MDLADFIEVEVVVLLGVVQLRGDLGVELQWKRRSYWTRSANARAGRRRRRRDGSRRATQRLAFLSTNVLGDDFRVDATWISKIFFSLSVATWSFFIVVLPRALRGASWSLASRFLLAF